MGIRLALGAGIRSLRWSLFVRSAGIVAAGAAVGILASVALGGVMHSFLFGVSPRDPLALASAPVVLLTAAAVAIWIPVLRHTRVDPAVTMRSE
jgi:ABC-type antimicrobial peptide transport system permease subunit